MDDDCLAVVQQLEVYLDGECPGDIEVVVQAHLQLCPPCLDRADFERHLRALVASRCREKAPPGLLERVLTVLQETRLSVPPREFQSPAPGAGRG